MAHGAGLVLIMADNRCQSPGFSSALQVLASQMVPPLAAHLGRLNSNLVAMSRQTADRETVHHEALLRSIAELDGKKRAQMLVQLWLVVRMSCSSFFTPILPSLPYCKSADWKT